MSIDANREMTDVYKCMSILKATEARWHSAGRLWYVVVIIPSYLPIGVDSRLSGIFCTN